MEKVRIFEKTDQQSKDFKGWLNNKAQDGSFYLNKQSEKNTWMMHTVDCKNHGRSNATDEVWSSASNPKVVAHRDYDVREHYEILEEWIAENGLKLKLCKNCQPEK